MARVLKDRDRAVNRRRNRFQIVVYTIDGARFEWGLMKDCALMLPEFADALERAAREVRILADAKAGR